jgi:hypothetical protein
MIGAAMFPNAFSLRTMLTLTVALAATLPARAQFPFSAEPADALVRAAFDTDYGRALMDTFAVSARRNGDPSCLEAKTLDAAALAGHGRALFQRYGSRMVETLNANFDRSAYQSALSASTGRNATAELERLERDPVVKKLIALNRPVRLAKVLDAVVESFDSYVMIKRIKLDPVGPLGSGDPELLRKNPTEATEAAVQRFVDEHPSRRLDRYFELVEAREAASVKGFTVVAMKLGPVAYFGGVETDLAELCVGRR